MFVMLKMLFDTCLDICQLVLTVSATVCVAAGDEKKKKNVIESFKN